MTTDHPNQTTLAIVSARSALVAQRLRGPSGSTQAIERAQVQAELARLARSAATESLAARGVDPAIVRGCVVDIEIHETSPVATVTFTLLVAQADAAPLGIAKVETTHAGACALALTAEESRNAGARLAAKAIVALGAEKEREPTAA
jgi:hypothetical protein